jgi:hypothetical protein
MPPVTGERSLNQTLLLPEPSQGDGSLDEVIAPVVSAVMENGVLVRTVAFVQMSFAGPICKLKL